MVPDPEAVLERDQPAAAPHLLVEGIDGTRIFTHFPPVDTYNAELTGQELAHAVANYAEKASAPDRGAVRFRRRWRRADPRDAGEGPAAA